MYADENGSTKSALFFESLPACQKPPQEFFDTLQPLPQFICGVRAVPLVLFVMKPSCKIGGEAADQKEAQGLEQKVDDLKEHALHQLHTDGQKIVGGKGEKDLLYRVENGEQYGKNKVLFGILNGDPS